MKTIREIYDNNGRLFESINEFLTQLETPKVDVPRPKKPTEDTSEAWEKYAKDLAAYEQAYQNYKKLSDGFYERRLAMEKELRLFLLERSGWLGHPNQDNAWKYAWEEGHSEGYYRVYAILLDLHEYFA